MNIEQIHARVPQQATIAPWLTELRQQAFAFFKAHGLPTRKQEDWKYARLHSLQELALSTPSALDKINANQEAVIKAHFLDAPVAARLVFFNGYFMPEFSIWDEGSSDILIQPLTKALETHEELLEAHIATTASAHRHGLLALNMAFMQEGVVVAVPADRQISRPIHILNIVDSALPSMYHMRHLIQIAAGAEVTLIEQWVGVEHSATNFTSSVMEMQLASAARMHYVQQLQLPDSHFHFHDVHASVQRCSYFSSHALALQGHWLRSDVTVDMRDVDADCNLYGLLLGQADHYVDQHTYVSHAYPRGSSYQMHKAILADKAVGVFNGKVYVAPRAQHINAQQNSKNILLSSQAEMNTKPELQIYANDVKCAHGAAVGQLDHDALFYLQTRGLSYQEAVGLLLQAFIEEALTDLPVAQIKPVVHQFLSTYLARSAKEVLL